MSIEDIVDEPTELSFANVVVITNLPVGVPPEKQPKLHSFLSKVISSDPSSDIIDIHMPLDSENSTTLGLAIVTVSEEAKVPPTIDRVDGFEVSKGQVLRAFPFDVAESIIEDALSTGRDGEPSVGDEIQIINRTSQRNWVIEEPRMEQLLARYDDETEIYWVDPLDPNPKMYYGGEREKVNGRKWCDLNVIFSPSGSYLATLHNPGIALWCGKNFSNKVRFEHTHVAGAIFSPNEEFLITWRYPISADDKEVVKVWRVLNGELLRCFSHTSGVLTTEYNECGFLWSPSSKYLARIVHGSIFVYEAPSMRLLNDPLRNQPSALRYSNVKLISWNPKVTEDGQDWLAIWIPEGANEPASMIVVDVGSRREITTKKLFSTGDSPAEIFWHPDGDYIALKASRLLTRSKKTGKTVFDIIRLNEKGCPSESIENFGSTIVSLAWEPVYNGRLSLVVGEEKKVTPSTTNPTGVVVEYKLKMYTVASGRAIEESAILPLTNASYNTIEWSPNGQYFVLYQGPSAQWREGEISAFAPDRKSATSGNVNGEIGFYSFTSTGGIELVRKDEHVNMNRVCWDPSGRFLITAVVLNVAEKNVPAYKMEQYSGYYLWTFQGRNLKKVDGVRLWNVQWRPHVIDILSVKEKKKLMKNLREKSQIFDEQDKAVKNAKKDSFMSVFRDKLDTFNDELKAIDEHFEERLKQKSATWAALYATKKNCSSCVGLRVD
jgi:translation initiation factor 3 subunit B